MATRTGNDAYHWEANAPILQTIWDAAGIDTIDASNQPRSIINLNAGTFSSIGNAVYSYNNLSIAKGVVIENAKGGNGNDILFGNEVSNRLEGGLGDDIYAGYKYGTASGNDVIKDTGGNDILEITNNRADAGLGNVKIQHTGGSLVLTLTVGNSVTLENFYSGNSAGSGAIETLAGIDWDISLVGLATQLEDGAYTTLGDIFAA